MATTTAILEFLETFGTVVESNEESSYVDLMMDDHKCVEFDGVQYYVPESNSFYEDDDLDIYDLLINDYLV